MTNAKLRSFIWKRQKVSGKQGEKMVMWSLLPFAVNVMLNLSNVASPDSNASATFWGPMKLEAC